MWYQRRLSIEMLVALQIEKFQLSRIQTAYHSLHANLHVAISYFRVTYFKYSPIFCSRYCWAFNTNLFLFTFLFTHACYKLRQSRAPWAWMCANTVRHQFVENIFYEKWCTLYSCTYECTYVLKQDFPSTIQSLIFITAHFILGKTYPWYENTKTSNGQLSMAGSTN